MDNRYLNEALMGWTVSALTIVDNFRKGKRRLPLHRYILNIFNRGSNLPFSLRLSFIRLHHQIMIG